MAMWHAFILPITGYFRRRRVGLMRQACPALFDDQPRTVLDLGGSRHFWSNLPIDLSLKRVVIYNISHSETQAADGSLAAQIPIKLYDGHRLPEADASFDIILSNSVLEHVPLAQRAAFVREIHRVGRCFLVQTPAFEFPVEPHFIFPMLHWLPRWLGKYLVLVSPWFLLSKPGKAHAYAYFDEIRLPSKREMAKLFPQAQLDRERVLGLTKSYLVSGLSNTTFDRSA